MARAKKEEQAAVGLVKVYAKQAPFVDLIKDVKIGVEPIEVELHPWLQANIDAGNIVVVE